MCDPGDTGCASMSSTWSTDVASGGSAGDEGDGGGSVDDDDDATADGAAAAAGTMGTSGGRSSSPHAVAASRPARSNRSEHAGMPQCISVGDVAVTSSLIGPAAALATARGGSLSSGSVASSPKASLWSRDDASSSIDVDRRPEDVARCREKAARWSERAAFSSSGAASS